VKITDPERRAVVAWKKPMIDERAPADFVEIVPADKQMLDFIDEQQALGARSSWPFNSPWLPSQALDKVFLTVIADNEQLYQRTKNSLFIWIAQAFSRSLLAPTLYRNEIAFIDNYFNDLTYTLIEMISKPPKTEEKRLNETLIEALQFPKGAFRSAKSAIVDQLVYLAVEERRARYDEAKDKAMREVAKLRSSTFSTVRRRYYRVAPTVFSRSRQTLRKNNRER
jgi:hypothetical protein